MQRPSTLARPSYLAQIVPQVPARLRGGMALLAPPRLLFRPVDAPADFVELQAPSPAAGQQRGHHAEPDLAGKHDNRVVATRQRRAPAADTPLLSNNPDPPPPPMPHAAPRAAQPQPDREIAPVTPTAARPALLPTPTAAIAEPVAPVTAISATSAAGRAPATGRSFDRFPEPRAAPGPGPAAFAAAPTAPKPPPAAKAPAFALPLLAPPMPPLRTPTPPRAPAAPSLHIGTLEVRVISPAPAATAVPQRAPPRPAPRPTIAGGRIARGFGVFGLGQS